MKKYYRVLRKKAGVSINHRYLKLSCWFPVSFVARLLYINTLPLSSSQNTDVFQFGLSARVTLVSSTEEASLHPIVE